MNRRVVPIGRWRLGAVLGVALIALTAIPGIAKIDLVTIPERAQIQLTIYNSEDLTLVREMRELTFSQGMNQIQFSWANTLIDPTSLQLIFTDRSEEFEVLDITYPANTQNVLIWNVEAKTAGPGRIEILYFCSGITWQADYVGKASGDETTMGLEGYVRVINNSGEDFENAQTRLVVGTINLVEKIEELARRGIIGVQEMEGARKAAGRMVLSEAAAVPAAASMDAFGGAGRLKEVVKQAVSEYQLYTIEGTEDIPTGWSKRLRSFSEDKVKIEVAYEYDTNKYGSSVIKLYRLKNDSEHELGKDPLPEGLYRVLRENGDGGLRWEGAFNGKYIPIGEKLEIDLGSDGLLTLETKRMEYQRINIDFDEYKNVRGWDIVETFKIELRNSKPTAVPVKVLQYFYNDWEIDPKVDGTTTTFRKKDQNSVEFETQVDGLSSRFIEYTLTTHFGTRSNQEQPR